MDKNKAFIWNLLQLYKIFNISFDCFKVSLLKKSLNYYIYIYIYIFKLVTPNFWTAVYTKPYIYKTIKNILNEKGVIFL